MDMNHTIRVARKGENIFPWYLETMEDGPETLYYIGNINLFKKPAAAVVGARKCSEYGKQVALKLGKILAQNQVVTVSGMAGGIDAFAHMGALNENGETIAVLGCGVDICYPRYNKAIYERICKSGLVVSEYPPGTKPKPWFFPRRNRIISAISEIVTVVEATADSGSLITAEIAAEQGKEIVAVPGNINSTYSLGCNKLISDGAHILTVPEDILRIMGISPKLAEEDYISLGNDEKEILKVLKENGEISLERLCAILRKDPTQISGLVTVLELKGLISYQLGKIFIAKF